MKLRLTCPYCRHPVCTTHWHMYSPDAEYGVGCECVLGFECPGCGAEWDAKGAPHENL